jgi:hypothetical protein
MFRPSPTAALIVALAIPAAALPTMAWAHHGWSSYDAEKVIKVTGPVTEVSWGNPHGAAKIRHQGKTWDVVLAPVARMEARGLSRAMLAPGKAVTLEGYPRKDGVPEMRIERVTVDGKTVELR